MHRVLLLPLTLHYERENVSLDERRREGSGSSYSVGQGRTSSCRKEKGLLSQQAVSPSGEFLQSCHLYYEE
jgi:hypothetical protein